MEKEIQRYLATARGFIGQEHRQVEMMLESGIRLAVEARRGGWGEEQEQRRQDEQEQWRQGEQGQNPGQEQSKQGKPVRFGEEEQLRETRAESTYEPKVTGRLAEVRTGRGSGTRPRER